MLSNIVYTVGYAATMPISLGIEAARILWQIGEVGATGASNTLTLTATIGRVAGAGISNAAPGLLSGGWGLIKGAAGGTYTAVTWAATNPAIRLGVTASAIGYWRLHRAELTEAEKAERAALPYWQQFLYNENVQTVLALVTAWKLGQVYGFVDESLLGAPSMIASGGSTAFSWAYDWGTTQVHSYLGNQLKLMDMAAWVIAGQMLVRAARSVEQKAADRRQLIENYIDIYGYTNIDDPNKAVSNNQAILYIVNALSSIKDFNLGKVTLPINLAIQDDFKAALGELGTASSKLYNEWANAPKTGVNWGAMWVNFKELAIVPTKYPKVAILTVLGVTVASVLKGEMLSAAGVASNIPNMNKLSGLAYGPAVVYTLINPVLKLLFLIPIPGMHSVATFAAWFTCETTMRHVSVGISVLSLSVSLLTIAYYEFDTLWTLKSKELNEALTTITQLERNFNEKLTAIKTFDAKGNPSTLAATLPQKVRDVATEFLKFKEKDRAEYIFAFAIKMLETGATEPDIRQVMKAVITSRTVGQDDKYFIDHKQPFLAVAHVANLENFLINVMHVLGHNANTRSITITAKIPDKPPAHNKNITLPQQELTDLQNIDKRGWLCTDKVTPFSHAVRAVLENLHQKAEREKPAADQGRG